MVIYRVHMVPAYLSSQNIAANSLSQFSSEGHQMVGMIRHHDHHCSRSFNVPNFKCPSRPHSHVIYNWRVGHARRAFPSVNTRSAGAYSQFASLRIITRVRTEAEKKHAGGEWMSKKTSCLMNTYIEHRMVAAGRALHQGHLFISDLWLEILPRRLHRSGSDYGNVLCELEG